MDFKLDQRLEKDTFLIGELPLSRVLLMNVATLGNLVPQLHTHVIARYKDDDAWPYPVWTFQNMLPYSDDEPKLQIDKIRKLVDDYEQGENYE